MLCCDVQYKERGVLNRLSALSADQRKRGVVCASSGNHGLALAYHATKVRPVFGPSGLSTADALTHSLTHSLILCVAVLHTSPSLNHKQLGVSSVCVFPVTTYNTQIQNSLAYGARVVLHGETFAEAYAKAREIAQSEGRELIEVRSGVI